MWTKAELEYIVRDHDAVRFAVRKAQLQKIAQDLNEKYGAGTIELSIRDSYYNMLEKIEPHFHLVENARAAIRAAGLAPQETPVRGGTDGATLSYHGLPLPEPRHRRAQLHGPFECITVEKMGPERRSAAASGDLYKDRAE